MSTAGRNWTKVNKDKLVERYGSQRAIEDLPLPTNKKARKRRLAKIAAQPDPKTPSTRTKEVTATIRCVKCGHTGSILTRLLAPGKSIKCTACGYAAALPGQQIKS